MLRTKTWILTDSEQKFASKNYNLVKWIAFKYRNTGFSEEDVTSMAHEALVKAVKDFDPQKGTFSTIFTWKFKGVFNYEKRFVSRKKRKAVLVSTIQDFGKEISILDLIPSNDPNPDEILEKKVEIKLAKDFSRKIKDPIDKEIWEKIIISPEPLTKKRLAKELGIHWKTISVRELRLLKKFKEQQNREANHAPCYKRCANCESPFVTEKEKQKFCSTACAKVYDQNSK